LSATSASPINPNKSDDDLCVVRRAEETLRIKAPRVKEAASTHMASKLT